MGCRPQASYGSRYYTQDREQGVECADGYRLHAFWGIGDLLFAFCHRVFLIRENSISARSKRIGNPCFCGTVLFLEKTTESRGLT